MRPMTAGLLITLAAVLLASWFLSTHEKVESEHFVGYQGIARINQHHAAQLFLLELGYDSESRATLTPIEWLPPNEDTLLVELSATMALGDERDSIREWIEYGGHLVLLPPRQAVAATDDFLADFSLRLVEVLGEDESLPDVEYDNEYSLSASLDRYRVGVTDSDTAAELITIDEFAIAVRRPIGDGYVTLLSSDNIFVNRNLQNADNARLLADLVTGDLEPGKIWIIYNTSFAPLWKIIWSAAAYLVTALALLLALWIWWSMPGFGPRVQIEERSRRSILEHISASGIFSWRQHGGELLLQQATQALVHDAEVKHPGISRQSPQRQAEIIARITGMSAQKIMDALQAYAEPKQREFTHSMQKLQSIRKEL